MPRGKLQQLCGGSDDKLNVLGELIRNQRHLANLSLRQTRGDDRGVECVPQSDRTWAPCAVGAGPEVHRHALNLSAEVLLAQAGLITEPARRRGRCDRGCTTGRRPTDRAAKASAALRLSQLHRSKRFGTDVRGPPHSLTDASNRSSQSAVADNSTSERHPPQPSRSRAPMSVLHSRNESQSSPVLEAASAAPTP